MEYLIFLMEHHLVTAHGFFVAVGNSDLNSYFHERLPKDSHFKLLRRITVGLFFLGFRADLPSFPHYSAQGGVN